MSGLSVSGWLDSGGRDGSIPSDGGLQTLRQESQDNVPLPVLRECALDVRLRDHIGGRDVWQNLFSREADLGHVGNENQYLFMAGLVDAHELEWLDGLDRVDPGLRNGVARYRLGLRVRAAEDTVLILARGQAAVEAAAGRAERARGGGDSLDTGFLAAGQLAEAVGDGLFRITHYFCRNPQGEGGYCEWMACRSLDGQPQRVGAGFVAGPSWRCGQQVEIGGIVFTYGDTGSWPIEADQVIDVACYGDDGDGSDPQWHFGWPGTAEYELPCPEFESYETVIWLGE